MENTGGGRVLCGRDHGAGVVAALSLTLYINTVCTQGIYFILWVMIQCKFMLLLKRWLLLLLAFIGWLTDWVSQGISDGKDKGICYIAQASLAFITLLPPPPNSEMAGICLNSMLLPTTMWPQLWATFGNGVKHAGRGTAFKLGINVAHTGSKLHTSEESAWYVVNRNEIER